MRKPGQPRIIFDLSANLDARIRRASAMNEETISAFIRRVLRKEVDRLGIATPQPRPKRRHVERPALPASP